MLHAAPQSHFRCALVSDRPEATIRLVFSGEAAQTRAAAWPSFFVLQLPILQCWESSFRRLFYLSLELRTSFSPTLLEICKACNLISNTGRYMRHWDLRLRHKWMWLEELKLCAMLTLRDMSYSNRYCVVWHQIPRTTRLILGSVLLPPPKTLFKV